MATPSTTTISSNQNIKTNTISSPLLRTVCLQDWWLVKAESNLHGKRLAVGGFALRERQAVRVFSAPIIKRRDSITLETEDGITIMIKGFINKSYTHGNGFSCEVCNHFLFGFPYYWEDYADLSFGKESTSGGVPISTYGCDGLTMSSDSSASRALSVCSDDFPLTRIRDLLMSTAGNSENSVLTNSIFTDILGKCSGNALKNPRVFIHSDIKCDSLPVTGAYVPEEVPCNHKKTKNEQKHGNDNGLAENVNILLAEERDNFNGDNCIDPVNEVLRRNSDMKRSYNVTHDALRDSMLKVNTEAVSLSKVGSQMPKGTSNNCELSGMGSLKRKGKSMLESKYLTRSSSRLQGSKSNSDDTKKADSGSDNRSTKICPASVSQDYDALAGNLAEEKLSGGCSSGLSNVGFEEIVEESLSKATNGGNLKVSGASGNLNYNSHEDLTMPTGGEMKIIHPSKVGARRRSNRLMNFKTKQEENLTSNSFIMHEISEPNEPSSASKAFENPGGKKDTRRSTSNVSHGGGMDNKEIPSKSAVKRSRGKPRI